MRPHDNDRDRKARHRQNVARVVAIVAALSMGVGFIVPAMAAFQF